MEALNEETNVKVESSTNDAGQQQGEEKREGPGGGERFGGRGRGGGRGVCIFEFSYILYSSM